VNLNRTKKFGACIKVKLFYDLLCSDCAETHHAIKTALDKDAGPGTKFKDIVQVDIIPYALPYFQHSFTLASVLPAMNQMGYSDQDELHFIEAIFEHQSEMLKDANVLSK
jgi:hypothetical protein